MDRKSFVYKLADGHEYIFTERNREDINYIHFQNQVRAERFRFINDNTKDDTDRLALLRLEMDKIYSDVEVGLYLMSNPDELVKLVYASFKISNPQIPFESFKSLVNEKIIRELNELIADLEKPEELFDDVITAELGIPQKKLAEWAKQQPRLYRWLKQVGNINIKKKEAESQQK